MLFNRKGHIVSIDLDLILSTRKFTNYVVYLWMNPESKLVQQLIHIILDYNKLDLDLRIKVIYALRYKLNYNYVIYILQTKTCLKLYTET